MMSSLLIFLYASNAICTKATQKIIIAHLSIDNTINNAV